MGCRESFDIFQQVTGNPHGHFGFFHNYSPAVQYIAILYGSQSGQRRLVKPPVIIGYSIIYDAVIYRVAVCPTGQRQPDDIFGKGDVFFPLVLDETRHYDGFLM